MDETKLAKYRIKYPDKREYHTLKREIWGEEIYYFKTDKINPLIIDIGAHIGMSVLYFKSIYPSSTIIAFEPNPNSFEILNENISMNNISDVTTINKAVWSENGTKDFYIPEEISWSSNSSFLIGGWTGNEKMKKISVQITTLDEYMNHNIDMLKIDTEGSEIHILKTNKKILSNVDNLYIEYHPVKNTNVNDIIKIIKPFFNIEVYYEGKICKKLQNGKLLTIKGKKLV